MYLEVYIDVIFLINFIMDFILLLIVKKVLKRSSSILRIVCGAGIGAIGACILAIMPSLMVMTKFLFAYVIICTAMVSITYYRLNWKEKIKTIIILYITTFFLGGVLNSLYYHSNLGYYFKELVNGNLFANRNKTFFFFGIIFGIAAIIVFIETLHSLRRGESELFRTEMYFGDKNVQVVGLFDTGNSLYDPISGKSVILAEYSSIEKLLSQNQANMLRNWLDTKGSPTDSMVGINSSSCNFNQDNTQDWLNIRAIPYHSVGKKQGILPAIVLKRLIIWNGAEQICNDKVLAAVSINNLSNKNEYQVILHRDNM